MSLYVNVALLLLVLFTLWGVFFWMIPRTGHDIARFQAERELYDLQTSDVHSKYRGTSLYRDVHSFLKSAVKVLNTDDALLANHLMGAFLMSASAPTKTLVFDRYRAEAPTLGKEESQRLHDTLFGMLPYLALRVHTSHPLLLPTALIAVPVWLLVRRKYRGVCLEKQVASVLASYEERNSDTE